MRPPIVSVFAASLALALQLGAPAGAAELKPAEAFRGIADKSERSLAVFQEIGKVLQHPRCVNCHPKGDSPLQGEDMAPHEPPVRRGDNNHGAIGMQCSTCHQARNVDHAEVPGHPEWHLAPRSMAWEGKTLGEICRQITDPERNGGKSLDELVKHMAEDSLVGWGWHPGAGREPAPGDQATFGNLFKYWVDSGAECPG